MLSGNHVDSRIPARKEASALSTATASSRDTIAHQTHAVLLQSKTQNKEYWLKMLPVRSRTMTFQAGAAESTNLSYLSIQGAEKDRQTDGQPAATDLYSRTGAHRSCRDVMYGLGVQDLNGVGGVV